MSEANSMDCRVGRILERCATLHGEGLVGVEDHDGCILVEGHDGPHEFIARDGGHWLWETDLECECEHCMRCEGDYCTTYWQKPNARLTAPDTAHRSNDE